MEAVRCHSSSEAPWVAVPIHPGSLRYPDRVIRAMVTATNAEIERLRDHSSDSVSNNLKKALDWGKRILREIPNRDVKVMVVSWSRRDREVSAEGLFEHVAPFLNRFRIVVFVDEAQNAPVTDMTRDVLDCLHRDPKGIPLVAAFFGLSDTEKILGDCGLSRLPDERVVNLEPLSRPDAANAIRGAFDAYGFSGTLKDRERWVDHLAELSQGWPQHINRVSVAASRVIQEHGGHIMMEHLDKGLEQGRERKRAYYARRLKAGSSRPWVYRQLALEANERDGTLSIDDIEFITESVRRKTSQTLDDFLTDALQAGLLAPDQDIPGDYKIPIPSLGDYLRALPEESRRNS